MSYRGYLVNTAKDILFWYEHPIRDKVTEYLERIKTHPLNKGLIDEIIIAGVEDFEEWDNMLFLKGAFTPHDNGGTGCYLMTWIGKTLNK